MEEQKQINEILSRVESIDQTLWWSG